MHDVAAPLVAALGWALLHFIWQGLLIGWCASLLLSLLGHARPQTRYAIACGALLLCAVLPLAGVLHHLGMAEPISAVYSAPVDVTNVSTSTTLLVLMEPGTLERLVGAVGQQVAWVVALWAAGAALMLLRLGVGLLWVQRQTRVGNYQLDPYWQGRLYALARKLDIGWRVRLGIVAGLDSPITAGCWRPVVLVPAALISGMPVALLEALLAHELAHIKRHDYLVNLLQSAIEVALFYHPSVWQLSRRIRVEREQIADDLAVGVLGERHSLALALSELDRFQFATPQLAHAAHGGNLMSRIQRLLRPKVEPTGWKTVIPLLGLGAACVVFYAHAAAVPPVPPVPPAPPVPAVAAFAPVAVAPPAAPVPPVPLAAPVAPVAPAAPALPARPARPSVTVAVTRNGAGGNSYALVRGGHDMTVSGRGGDLANVDYLRRTIDGDFLWASKDGHAYVIRDPAILAKATAAWKEVDRFGPQMDAYGRQMDAQGKVMDALGRKMADHTLGGGSGATDIVEQQAGRIDALARQQDALGNQMERLGDRMEAASTEQQRAALQAEMALLQTRMADLGRQMAPLQATIEAQTERYNSDQAPIRELARQMKEAGKPMAALGRQMHALGEQQQRASQQADEQTRQLIEQAISHGQAQPVPDPRAG